MQAQSKAIILARVSSKAQEEEGYSLDSQLKLLREYCRAKNLEIVREYKIAETASKQDRRKVFHELLTLIIKQRVYHLVVEKTDRLTRNYKDAISIDDWLEGNDKRMLHIVKENLQLHKGSRSDAKFMLNIYLAFSKKYIDNLREEAMKGWAEKLAQGWLPSSPPPGYMTVTENGKRIHIPNPSTVALMQRVFELYLLPDHTTLSITKEMTNMGLVTSRGRPFSRSQVHRILGNPFYIGTNHFDGKDYPGAQEPIIDKDVFDRAQRKLRRKSSPKYRKHNPLLRGLLRCGHCHALITWQVQKGIWYGACQRKLEACKEHGMLRQDRVERTIIQELERISDPAGKLVVKLQSAIDVIRPQYVGTYREKLIDSLKQQLARRRRMDEKLYEDRLAGNISDERYRSKHEEFDEEISRVQSRLDRIYEAQKEAQPEAMPKTKRTDPPLIRLYLKSSTNEKRVIMASLFKDMVVRGSEIVVKRA